MSDIKLDCSACKTEQSMVATKIGKFSGFIRFIGFLIAAPSVLGVAFALLMLFSTGSATSEVMDTAVETESAGAMAGAAAAGAIGFGLSAFVGFGSLIGGLIGWLLLMKRKVFKCIKCSFIMERG